MSEQNMQWVKDLYKQTHDLWIKNGKDSSGYAIFYTPVIKNPELLIIGYNPGGDENSFDASIDAPPGQHDYFVDDYDLAKRMKSLFTSAGILDRLKSSVKINLYFFRSRNSDGIESLSKEAKDFCLQQTKEIINKLQPKIILTEGFKTFEVLTKLLKIKQESQESMHDKAILVSSTFGNIPIIGILHPTGAHGVTNEIREKTAGYLSEFFANK